jgi:hypothetical protein
MALVLFFCSGQFDMAVVAEEMAHLFAGVQVVGCTTAGEIGPDGYHGHSISGASFSADDFVAVAGSIPLPQFDPAAGQELVAGMLSRMGPQAPSANGKNGFAILLVDGMCGREELVARSLQGALGGLPMVGGSAGDDLEFGSTHIYCDGRFHSGMAALVLVATRLPFRLFQTQHFIATDSRAVVTEADTALRLVREIDGWPAAEVYARLIGVEVGDLAPVHFAASPMVVVISGTNHVRSIRNANADGSLTLFCAIDEGVVLRVARGADLLRNLEDCFAAVRQAVGEPQLVIGFDCVLRRLDILRSGQRDAVAEVMRRNRVTGFNSYGEQYRGAHMNQTFVGVAIGGAE